VAVTALCDVFVHVLCTLLVCFDTAGLTLGWAVTARYSEGSLFRRFPTLGLVGLVGVGLGNLWNNEPSEYRPITGLGMHAVKQILVQLEHL